MEKQINGDSTVTQLWNPISLRNPEDAGDVFSETSVLTRAARYKAPEGIYNRQETLRLFSFLFLFLFLCNNESPMYVHSFTK
jgi:hypothetical protein